MDYGVDGVGDEWNCRTCPPFTRFVGRITPTCQAARIRLNMNMSQGAFADLLGVSRRTVQQWEQGRRKPSGAARSLLQIAEKRPDVLRKELGIG